LGAFGLFLQTTLMIVTIKGSELVSSFVARQVMALAFKVDVSQVGMDEMREYPELGQLVMTYP